MCIISNHGFSRINNREIFCIFWNHPDSELRSVCAYGLVGPRFTQRMEWIICLESSMSTCSPSPPLSILMNEMIDFIRIVVIFYCCIHSCMPLLTDCSGFSQVFAYLNFLEKCLLTCILLHSSRKGIPFFFES